MSHFSFFQEIYENDQEEDLLEEIQEQEFESEETCEFSFDGSLFCQNSFVEMRLSKRPVSEQWIHLNV